MSEEWKVVKEWIDDGDGSEVEIFHVFIGTDQITDLPIERNDAHIMAAAKDMLLALEGLVGAFDKIMGPNLSAKGPLYVAAVNAIRKARSSV